MGKTEKSAATIGIIGGADGPTAVFTAGRKIPLKHRIRRMWYDLKRKRIAKRIKPEPHSMEEVMQYLQSRYGFIEADKDSEEYIREYQEMRCSSILQYAPELLGEYATPPRLTGQDEEGIRKFQAELEKRQQCAAQIPKETFDIEYTVFERKDKDGKMQICFEKRFGYIGANASGTKKYMKSFGKIYRDVYRYYGVTQEDIDNSSRRYKDLINILAR